MWSPYLDCDRDISRLRIADTCRHLPTLADTLNSFRKTHGLPDVVDEQKSRLHLVAVALPVDRHLRWEFHDALQMWRVSSASTSACGERA